MYPSFQFKHSQCFRDRRSMDLSSKGATPKNQFHEWHEISLIRLCCNAFSANRLNKFIRELTLDYGCLASLFQAIGGCIAKRIYSSYFLKTKTEVGLESLFLNCTSFGGAYKAICGRLAKRIYSTSFLKTKSELGLESLFLA